jgi:hypothetical protein
MTQVNSRHWVKLRALSDEVDAVSTLLRHGLDILSTYRYATRDADAVFVCLASGAEKLLKLTVGLYELNASGSWPSKATMQGKYGHDIVRLDREVQHLIKDHSHDSTVPGLIDQLIAEVSADPYLSPILETLGRYAIRGRFYNLDVLAEAPQPAESPAQLWEELHQKLLEQRPDLLSKIASADWESGRAEINALVVASVRQWAALIVRAWMTGVIGPQAKVWAPQFDLGK